MTEFASRLWNSLHPLACLVEGREVRVLIPTVALPELGWEASCGRNPRPRLFAQTPAVWLVVR